MISITILTTNDMANYSTLKAAIQQVIKENGNNEITGNLLQQSLLTMINSLGSGYQFVGGATPATNPGTPDNNVFYLATENGTYTNFGGIVVENEIAFLAWNGTWVKTSIQKGGGNTIITNSDISTTPYLDILFDEDLALRIDMMAPYTGGTTETRCGSIIVSVKYYNDECFSEAYYYGHDLNELLSNIAIVTDGNAKYLRLSANTDNDFIVFRICPIDTNFSSAALSSESATTIQTIVPQVLILPSKLKTINNQSLVGSGNINIVSPKIVTFNGSYDAIALTLGNANRTFRVDVIETDAQVDLSTRIGSLLISCSSDGGTGTIDTAIGYYYGYNKSWMIEECAIYMDDPEIYPDGNHFLIIQPNPDGFPVTLSIMPLDGLDVTVFEHNPGDEDIKVSDANITTVGGGVDGKIGVISQTQTWTLAADGGWDYAMSNQVTGLIPQANIDLFESAGAVFNATTGYFELNGLTDLSYNEMQAVYFNSIGKERLINYEQAFAGKPIRTNLTLFSDTVTAFGSVAASQINCRGITTASMIEVFNWSNNESPTSTITKYRIISSMDFAFRTVNGKLKKIIGILNCQNLSSISVFTFQNQTSIEDIKLFGIKGNTSIQDSRRLTVASVAFMVENAANTAQITITLHPTAFARCQADTTEYTYQGNTYVGIINLATAHNIVIQSA